MTDKVVVLVSCATAREARTIARSLVKEHIAACVNVSRAAVQSIYRWKGKVETADEVLLAIKTSKRALGRLERRVRELHGYEVPEIVALPIVAGSRAYLRWIDESVRATGRKPLAGSR